MNSRTSILWAVLRASLCVCAWAAPGGCGSVKPVAVMVRDAETGKPLPAAKITLDYWNDPAISRKKSVVVWTDGYGVAQVPARRAASSPRWEIEAQHYINATIYGTPGERVPPEIRPRPSTQPLIAAAAGRVKDTADVRLYRTPVPAITIVVGDKFRGRVVFHVTRSDDWVQDDRPGKRQFTFSPDADGVIEVPATPLLARELCRPFGYSAIRFETRSGRELDKDWAAVTSALAHSRAAPDAVCARLISDRPRWEKGLWRETTSVYVIGTAADARAAATQP